MRARRRSKRSEDKAALRASAAASLSLKRESLIPRRGTWGARPSSAGVGLGGTWDGQERSRQDGLHGPHQPQGATPQQDDGEPRGECDDPGRSPVQRVRWNLSA